MPGPEPQQPPRPMLPPDHVAVPKLLITRPSVAFRVPERLNCAPGSMSVWPLSIIWPADQFSTLVTALIVRLPPSVPPLAFSASTVAAVLAPELSKFTLPPTRLRAGKVNVPLITCDDPSTCNVPAPVITELGWKMMIDQQLHRSRMVPAATSNVPMLLPLPKSSLPACTCTNPALEKVHR